MAEVDHDVAALKVGDQFWAVSARSRTPYEVIAVEHKPGAANHVWAEVRARELMEASKPFDQMPLISLCALHGNEVRLRRRVT